MSWIANAVPKQVCRFLLNRYLGELLLEKVTLEQLTVDVVNGTGTIKEVYLDVQHINDSLQKCDLPFEIVEGFIGQIEIQIPYSKLLNDSCNIEISGLEITLQPKPTCQTTDLVSSMIESVIGSMTTSIDLARSFVEEQQTAEGYVSGTDQKFHGIDALAQLIQIILSRMKINFNNIIIRLEHFSSSIYQETGIALEAQIDRIEFVDECVDAQTPSSAPITEQPQQSSMHFNTNDLSKILRLYGVRLFTDIFSKPEGGFCKSLVVRRKISEASTPIDAFPDMMSSNLSVYKSCCTNNAGSGGGDHKSVSGSSEFSSSTHSFDSSSLLSSKPLLFAQFPSDKLTIRIRLKNNNPSNDSTAFKRDEIDIEMFLGALNVFLTPTQLYLLMEIGKSLFCKSGSLGEDGKGGKPMQDDDYFNVEMDLRKKIEENRLPSSCFGHNSVNAGNWSGEDKFYNLSSKTPHNNKYAGKTSTDDNEFISIPMSCVNDNSGDFLLTHDDYKPLNVYARRKSRESKQSSANHGFSVSDSSTRPNSSRCKICLTHLLVVLPHNDPFCNTTNIAASTATVANFNQKFFESTKTLSFAGISSLKRGRKYCNEIYEGDHLRLIACPVVTEWIRNHTDAVQMCVTCNKLEILEYLYVDGKKSKLDNNVRHSGPNPAIIELISFSESEESVEHSDLRFQFGTEDQRNYVCTLQLKKCTMEFDITIVDRLHNLFFCQPTFKMVKIQTSNQQNIARSNNYNNRYLFEVPSTTNTTTATTDHSFTPNVGMREDWFESLNEKVTSPSTCVFDVLCPNLTVNLRFPVPDLRPLEFLERSPWWIRNVRGDFLQVDLEDVKFKTILCENTCKLGSFAAEFSKANVYFYDENLEQTFKLIHAFSSDHEYCSFEFKWDFINRSLLDDRENGGTSAHNKSADNLLGSLERNCFKFSSSSNFEGPFLKKHVAHENEQLTIVGTKTDMKDFRRKCLKQCAMGIHLRLFAVRLFLPDKSLYELLYNRLINDLAFWSPSNPSFQGCFQTASAGCNVLATVSGTDGDKFAPCRAFHKIEDSDSGSESTIKSSIFWNNNASSKRKGAHKFSFLLQCGSVDSVITFDEETSSYQFASKIRYISRNMELFVVYGYDNDDNTSYFYITSESCTLKHSHSISNDKESTDSDLDVEHGKFADCFDWKTIAEPTPSNLALKTEQDDNFSLAIRLVFQPKENIKEFLITFGIRNSTLHYRPCSTAEDFWLIKLVRFFDVVDYPVLGFEAPKVINDIHLHAWNLAIQYKPDNLPHTLRCCVDSFDLSTNIVQEAAMFRFHVILEDLSLFLTDKSSSITTAADDLTIRDYVCLMKMGFFELILINHEPPDDNNDLTTTTNSFDDRCSLDSGNSDIENQPTNQRKDKDTPTNRRCNSQSSRDFPVDYPATIPTRTKPFQEVQIQNDVLEIRTCVDSLVALQRLLQSLTDGGNNVGGSVNSNSPVQSASDKHNNLLLTETVEAVERFDNDDSAKMNSERDEKKLCEMMTSAMQDITTTATSATTTPSTTDMCSALAMARTTKNNVIRPKAAYRTSVAKNPSKSADASSSANSSSSALRRNTVLKEFQSEASGGRKNSANSVDQAKQKSNMSSLSLPQPIVRQLDDDPVQITDYHFPAPLRRTDLMSKLPDGYPLPLLQYIIKDFTVSCFLYGGRDFGSNLDKKVYSGLPILHQTPKFRRRVNEAKRNIFTVGGKNRDHTVSVELHLNKICCLHELYPPDYAQVARQIITVQEIQIRDHMFVSNINKLLYLFSTEERPKQTYTPMFCLKLLQFLPETGEAIKGDGDCSLKISLLPIRLHIDQDTLQFLIDFSKDFSDMSTKNGLKDRRTRHSSSLPSIKVAKSHSSDTISQPASSTNMQDQQRSADSPRKFVSGSNRLKLEEPIISAESKVQSPEKPLNLDLNEDLFSGLSFVTAASEPPEFKFSSFQEKPDNNPVEAEPPAERDDLFVTANNDEPFATNLAVETDADFNAVRFSSSKPSTSRIVHTPDLSETEINKNKAKQETADIVINSTSHKRNRTISNTSVRSDCSELIRASQANQAAVNGLYFKSFVFSPAVDIRLDYFGKRVQIDQGALSSILMGLGQLNSAQIRLKELHNRHGLLGFDRVAHYAVNEWLSDIRRNQVYNLVGGMGPVHTLIQVSQGIIDLFWLPVDQYRRDGHVVKGIQRGAQSFGVSTASAALELTQQLVGTLQCVAEFAFDIVNPEYPPKPNDLLQALAQPYDFREGVHMACATVYRGFTETAEAITLATQEEKAHGRWAIRGVLRQATPTVIRPLVVATRATTHILGGLRNQLRPDSWREEQNKWKNND